MGQENFQQLIFLLPQTAMITSRIGYTCQHYRTYTSKTLTKFQDRGLNEVILKFLQ